MNQITPGIMVLGIMSGSSLDGLDMALCTFTGDNRMSLEWKCLETCHVPFEPDLKKGLGQVYNLSARDLLQLENKFTTHSVESIAKFFGDIKIQADYIAHHGHTVFHFPQKGFTHQIINGAQLATVTKIPTIVDFRSADIALGGQGAPLAPVVESWLFSNYKMFLNLGGIANVSFHRPSGEIMAFDICPCNQTLNTIANELNLEYDAKGMLAAKGQIISDLLEQWNRISYFSQPHPKSLDNQWCKEKFTALAHPQIGSPNDRLRTTVEFISEQIKKELEQVNPSQGSREILITGGGVYNAFLVNSISNKLKGINIEVIVPDKQIVDYKEAILMALIGYLRINQMPNSFASVTGASSDTCNGAIYLP